MYQNRDVQCRPSKSQTAVTLPVATCGPGSAPEATGSAVGTGLQRRDFIKSLVFGSAVSCAMGKTWLEVVGADCQPSASGAGILHVNVADFPALQQTNGSVRLALNTFVRSGPLGPFYPVLVNRGSGQQFYAMSSHCNHSGCVVPPYSAAARAIVCACHGSRYGIDGALLSGPSPQALARYPVSFDGATLCIEVPGLGFKLAVAPLDNAGSPRIQLQFPTGRNVTYEVLFQSDLLTAPSVVSFSTTPTGTANTPSFVGTGKVVSLYLDRTTASGIISVRIKVAQG